MIPSEFCKMHKGVAGEGVYNTPIDATKQPAAAQLLLIFNLMILRIGKHSWS